MGKKKLKKSKRKIENTRYIATSMREKKITLTSQINDLPSGLGIGRVKTTKHLFPITDMPRYIECSVMVVLAEGGFCTPSASKQYKW